MLARTLSTSDSTTNFAARRIGTSAWQLSCCLLALCLLTTTPVLAQSQASAKADRSEPTLRLPAPDDARLEAADQKRVSLGRVAHFATPRPVDVDPWRSGRWRAVEPDLATEIGSEFESAAEARWTLDVVAENASSVSLHFDRFGLPPGARLVLRGSAGASRPLTAADTASENGLWTPPVLGERAHLELTVPIAALDLVDLHLAQVFHGYAGFAEPHTTASACRLDVSCADEAASGDDSQIADLQRSVGLLVVDGVRFCTGFLVSDALQSGRPLLLTAGHCGVTPANAASVVVLWNYRRPSCGAELPSPAAEFQTGATLLARNYRTDLALLELTRRPEPSWNLAWVGWDRSDDHLGGAFTIHHPDAAPQSLARTAEPVLRSRHFSSDEEPGGDHLRVRHWSAGTTEGGSSGAPLFDAEGRVRGWLRGGHAACDNRLPDWFGRLADAWDDLAGPTHRLRDWLDPTGTEMMAVDGWAPEAPPATEP